MKKATKKELFWMVILTLGLILFFATGCKPKQTINEKIVYKSDSTAIWKLETQLEQKELENKTLRVDLNRVLFELNH